MPAGVPAARVQTQIWNDLRDAPSAGVTASDLARAAGVSFQTVAHRLGLWSNAGLVIRTDRRPRRYRLSDQQEANLMPPMIDARGRAIARRPTSADRLWAAMRVLKRFDLPVLQITAGTTVSTTRGYLGLLQRAGYVRMEKMGNPRTGECSRYQLVRNTGRAAPRETVRIVPGGNTRLLIDPNTGEQHDVSRGAPSLRRKYRSRAPSDRGVG